MEQYEIKKRNLLSFKTKFDSPRSIIPLKGTKNSGYSPDTGERFRIERELDIERKKKFARINSNRKKNKFTNTNMHKIDYICRHLTNAQIGYLMILQCYIDYDGRLIRSQKDKTSLTFSEIRDVLKLSDSSFCDFRDRCLNAGILDYEKEQKSYSIKQIFIFKGAFKGMQVVSVVTKEMKKMSRELKPTDLAILFKLQKYVHFESMALVKDPTETNKNKIKTIKPKDLVDILGVSQNYIYGRLPKLTYNGQALIAIVKAGKKKSYMLNPKVFFRGDYAQVQEKTTHPNSLFFKID